MEEKEFRCKCGHIEYQSDIHGIADWTGTKFWGDLCDDCFSNADLVLSDENVSDWKWKSKDTQLERS